MPRIPTLQNLTPPPAPGPAGGLQAPDFGPGIGPGLKAVGEGVDQAADAARYIEHETAETGAKDKLAAYAQYRDQLLYTNDDAFYRQEGQNAVNAHADVAQKLRDKYGELASSVSPLMGHMLRDSIGSELEHDLTGVGTYAGKQLAVANDKQDSALQWQMGRSASTALLAGDEKSFATSLGTMVQSIRTQNARNGLSGPYAQEAEDKAIAGVWGNIIQQKAASDPAAAQALFDQHRAEIKDPDVSYALERMIQPAVEDQEADTRANFIRAHPDPHAVPLHSPGSAVALDGNNPGGISDGRFARSQPGYVGSNGRYAAFDTMDHGAGAQKSLLHSYVTRGYDTPATIAARWAPAGDGKNDPVAYANFVAGKMGIGVHDKIGPAQIDAFAAAQGKQENRAYTPGMATAPVNAPQHNDLNAQLAVVDGMDLTARQKQGVKEKLIQKAGLDERLLHADQQQAADQAWTVALDPGATSVRSIPPAVWAHVAPETQRSIMEQLKQNAAPKPIPPNPDLYYKLSTVAASNPQAFAKLDLRPYATQLPKADWDQFATLQRDAIHQDAKSPKMVSYGRMWQLSSSAFQAAGFATGAKAKPEDRSAQTSFMNHMVSEASAWEQTHGKPPGDNDLIAIRDKLLMTVDQVAPGRLWGERHTDVPLFQAGGHYRVPVPDSVRDRIVASFQRTHNGAMPSDQAIGTTYLQHKGDLWP